MQRQDEWLHHARRAVVGARIAPVLEEMGLGHVPRAGGRRLVVVQREVDGQRHALRQLREVEVGRGVVRRIAAEDAEELDAARAHVLGELAQRVAAIDGRGDRLDVRHGVSGRAELRVEGMHEGVRLGAQAFAGDDECFRDVLS